MFKKWFDNNKNKVDLLPYISEPLYGLSPNDPQMMGWEISKFNIPNLWSKSTGKNVTVAVIDTGCDLDHKDLQSNLLSGKNFVNPNSEPYDKVGHGTHVASTIAAANNSVGMVGVAPDTKIIPLKALDDNGRGDIRNVIDAVLWAADCNDIDIITMSLGSSVNMKPMHDAIKYAVSKKKSIFCAAGNSGTNSGIMYPAVYDEVVAIGSIDQNLNRTDFTCSGPELDFLAPGHNILGCVPGNKYAMMSGTSMSNPFAVGCASLLLSYKKKNGIDFLSSNDYIDYFKLKSVPLKDSKYNSKNYQGYGIITPYL